MGRYGKDSLIREISLADTKKLDKQTAALARSYLNQYSFEEVRSVSNGAAVFYLWVSMARLELHVLHVLHAVSGLITLRKHAHVIYRDFFSSKK